MLSAQGRRRKGGRLGLTARLHNGYDVLAVDLAYRAAPQDLAVIAEPIDERAALIPAGLLQRPSEESQVGPHACLTRKYRATPTSHRP